MADRKEYYRKHRQEHKEQFSLYGRQYAMLCHFCNTDLGKFGESIETLKQAIAYLEKYDG